MNYKEKATILRVCSSKEGERCSRCPAFGQGNRHCRRNVMRDASVAITDLLARAEAAEARAEKAERERDAAVSDLLRAEEAAEEAGALLDSEVHPICDYSLYLDIHDSVSEIVNWKKDDVWRKKE